MTRPYLSEKQNTGADLKVTNKYDTKLATNAGKSETIPSASTSEGQTKKLRF